MSEICMGYDKTNKQKCKNRISAERSGKTTCGNHKSQESILENYKGAKDDLETLSRFHQRIFGENHPDDDTERLEYLKPERFAEKKGAKWRAFGGSAKESDFNGSFEPGPKSAFQDAAWEVLANTLKRPVFSFCLPQLLSRLLHLRFTIVSWVLVSFRSLWKETVFQALQWPLWSLGSGSIFPFPPNIKSATRDT